MKKTGTLVLISLLLLWGCPPRPKEVEHAKSPKPPEAVVINENTNIHYTGLFCDECHTQTPVAGSAAYLKYNGDYQQLCRCHQGMSPGYCHPLETIPASAHRKRLPAGFPLKDGKFTCNTCHDVYRQCQKRLFDRQSLRGAPYTRKSDFCYRCHNKTRYEKLNAHHQLKADGTPDVKMCLYCHRKKPDEKTATYKEVTFIGDIKTLCRRCHQIAGNHSGNFDHTSAVPSPAAAARMAVMKERFHIILPLAKDGKMTCITCHNPHQKGVIAADLPAAKGADSKFRQRLPGRLCIECHQM